MITKEKTIIAVQIVNCGKKTKKTCFYVLLFYLLIASFFIYTRHGAFKIIFVVTFFSYLSFFLLHICNEIIEKIAVPIFTLVSLLFFVTSHVIIERTFNFYEILLLITDKRRLSFFHFIQSPFHFICPPMRVYMYYVFCDEMENSIPYKIVEQGCLLNEINQKYGICSLRNK